MPKEVVNFAKENDVWLHKMVAQHASEDPYWFQVWKGVSIANVDVRLELFSNNSGVSMTVT